MEEREGGSRALGNAVSGIHPSSGSSPIRGDEERPESSVAADQELKVPRDLFLFIFKESLANTPQSRKVADASFSSTPSLKR